MKDDATIALVTERLDLAERAGVVQVEPWRNSRVFAADQIVAVVGTDQVSVICIGDDVPLPLALEVAELATGDHGPAVAVVLVATPTEELWRDAVRAGVRDVIDPALVDVELEPALGRALEWTARTRRASGPFTPPSPTTGRGGDAAPRS
jgi:hypothetical protein